MLLGVATRSCSAQCCPLGLWPNPDSPPSPLPSSQVTRGFLPTHCHSDQRGAVAAGAIVMLSLAHWRLSQRSSGASSTVAMVSPPSASHVLCYPLLYALLQLLRPP